MPKTKRQKIYRMKGCSKRCKKHKKHNSKKHLGGNKYSSSNKYSGGGNMNLAYTGKPIFSIPDPHLAYTGKENTNSANPVYPNTGPPAMSQNWLGSSIQHGGSCGGTCPLQRGGNGLPYGQGLPLMKSIPYPNGLTGGNWGADFKWPGTNNVGGDFNHYSENTYNNDVPNQMIATGAQPPFSVGGGRKMRKNKSLKGGGISNFLYQDLVNVGRQAQFGLGSTYNALRGFSAPVNPMPWQGQLASKH